MGFYAGLVKMDMYNRWLFNIVNHKESINMNQRLAILEKLLQDQECDDFIYNEKTIKALLDDVYRDGVINEVKKGVHERYKHVKNYNEKESEKEWKDEREYADILIPKGINEYESIYFDMESRQKLYYFLKETSERVIQDYLGDFEIRGESEDPQKIKEEGDIIEMSFEDLNKDRLRKRTEYEVKEGNLQLTQMIGKEMERLHNKYPPIWEWKSFWAGVGVYMSRRGR